MICAHDGQRGKVYGWEERSNRLTIRLPDTCPSWWLLHELAHSLTSSQDGRSDGHGAKFMGLYAQLLTRYLRLPMDALLTSLHTVGIEIDQQAVPVFLDAPEPARTSSRGRGKR